MRQGTIVYSPSEKYCRSIRNYDKRKYAWAYRDFLRCYTTEAPPRPDNLSVMAAQAVEMRLRECMR